MIKKPIIHKLSAYIVAGTPGGVKPGRTAPQGRFPLPETVQLSALGKREADRVIRAGAEHRETITGGIYGKSQKATDKSADGEEPCNVDPHCRVRGSQLHGAGDHPAVSDRLYGGHRLLLRHPEGSRGQEQLKPVEDSTEF